jgi:hypothetical protein
VNSDPFATRASSAIFIVGALSPCTAITRIAASMIAFRLSSSFGLGMRLVYT